MKRIKHLVLVMLTIFGLTLVSPAAVYAGVDITDVKEETCKGTGGTSSGSGCTGGQDIRDIFKNVINILLFIVGAVAVIMLVIGGFRYVTSSGDQNAASGAKNTIMYALIGIVVAFLAFAAVNFVTDQLIK